MRSLIVPFRPQDPVVRDTFLAGMKCAARDAVALHGVHPSSFYGAKCPEIERDVTVTCTTRYRHVISKSKAGLITLYFSCLFRHQTVGTRPVEIK